MVLAIFVAYEFKPLHSYVNHMSQVVLNVGKFCLDACYKFVGLVFVVFQYALHLYFEQTQNVVACDVAVECIFVHVGIASACVSGRHTEHLILERLKLGGYKSHNLVLRLGLLKLLLFVYAFLYEYALQ